jgi:hypothetical protein
MRSPWQLLCAIGRVIGAIGTYEDLEIKAATERRQALRTQYFPAHDRGYLSPGEALECTSKLNGLIGREVINALLPFVHMRSLWRGLPS